MMKRLVSGLLISSISLLPLSAMADHPPKRLLKNFMAFSALGTTGKLADFDVNVAVYGALPNGKTTTKDNPALDKIFADKFNLAAIVMKGDEIVYERYNSQKGIDSHFPLLGMSMSKTAAGAAVGTLLCDGRLKSLDDKAGDYSSFLRTTPYRDVSVRNILQMNSGVSPIGRSDEKRFNRKSRGVANFSGAADVRGALKFYKMAARKQGETMNYHSSDTLALSVLVEDIAGKPLSDVFHQHVFQKFSGDRYMHWTADKSGTTVTYSDLVMTAKDWAHFGRFIMTERRKGSCLGAFFNEGVKNAVASPNPSKQYGFQSWVYQVNGQPTFAFQGHGGQFLVLDDSKDTVLLTLSFNESYAAGNLFKNIAKFAEKLD